MSRDKKPSPAATAAMVLRLAETARRRGAEAAFRDVYAGGEPTRCPFMDLLRDRSPANRELVGYIALAWQQGYVAALAALERAA